MSVGQNPTSNVIGAVWGYAKGIAKIYSDYQEGGIEKVAQSYINDKIDEALPFSPITGNWLKESIKTENWLNGAAAVKAASLLNKTGFSNQQDADQIAHMNALDEANFHGTTTVGPSVATSLPPGATVDNTAIYHVNYASFVYDPTSPNGSSVSSRNEYYTDNPPPGSAPIEYLANGTGFIPWMTNSAYVGAGLSSIPDKAAFIDSISPTNGLEGALPDSFGGIADENGVALLTHESSATLAGDYGSLTLDASGNFSYQPNAAASLPTGSHPTESFAVALAIDSNGSGTYSIALNRAPITQTETASVTAGHTISLDASHGALVGDTDPDGDALTISAVGDGTTPLITPVAGTYGHLTLNADGSYIYAADNIAALAQTAAGTSVHDTFAFTVDDGYGGTATSTLTIDLGSGYATQAGLFGSVTHDAHSSGGEVYALYEGLLGRAPDTLGLEYWADQFDHGASPAALAAGFLASPEGQARLGASDDAGFVNQLYQNTLGRSGDAGGLSYWTDQLSHGTTRVDVADSFVFSSEFTASVQQALGNGLFVPDAQAGDVARLYYTMLDRAPDTGGLQYWTNQLEHGGSLTSLAQGFLSTPENQAKYGSLASSAYVDALYENALGRHADADGLDYWTHRLDSGVSRADLAVQLSDSPESHTVHLTQIELGWHLA